MSDMNTPPKPQKLAVLGGGLGALSTVYELTHQENWQESYDITVYQQGWRLGGKLASGRNQDQGMGNRIEEATGLHFLLGYYNNLFRVIQECHDELGSAWEDDFYRQTRLLLQQHIQDDNVQTWKPWQIAFHKNRNGIGKDYKSISPSDYILRMVQLFELNWQLGIKFVDEAFNASKGKKKGPNNKSLKSFERKVKRLANKRRLKTHLKKSEGGADDYLDALQSYTKDTLTQHVSSSLFEIPLSDNQTSKQTDKLYKEIVGAYTDGIYDLLYIFSHAATFSDDIGLWLNRSVIVLKLLCVTLRGFLYEVMTEMHYNGKSFEAVTKALDSQDYREWLKKHGADDAVLYSSPVRQVYVIYESYPEGEVGAENPSRAGSIGAWLALRTLLPAVLDYRGAPVWLPKTSVGEAVVAPLYQILKKRGVKFKFFHKIKQVVPDTSRQTIDHIILAQQVTLKPKAPKSRTDPTSYDPLVDINGRLCWPNQPLYEQLKQGQALQDLNDPGALESYWTTWEDAKPKVKLTQGKDFDLILLGISIGALSKICEPSFYKPNDPTWQKWHAMLTHIPAISLQSCQLWFNRSLRWKSKALCMSGFANLFNSALDTTEVITKWENWGELKPPKAGINFVTPLPTNDLPPSDHHWFPHEQQELVRKNVDKMLHEQAKYLWPRAKAVQGDEEQGFEYEFLYNFGLQNVTAYSTAKNPAATVTQYWKAVINPSDRYNLALPGSEQYRLKSGESGFQNLYLAGDWIDNEHFNVGCTEATVISGLAACKAISGTQRDVIGFELEKLIRSLCEDLDWETYETITEGIQTLETIVDTVADDLDLFEVVEDDPGLISKIETIGLSLARPSLRHIQKSGGQFVGTSLSYIAPLPVSSQRLTSLLPDSLVLAPQPFTASGEHPFLLIFSKQRSLSFTPLQSLVPLAVAYDQFLANYFDIGYLQMMGVIPFVKPKQSENRVSSIHSYISHMFVNQRLPAIGGEIYGQSTRLANIGLTKNSYYVDDLKTHAPIISGDFVLNDQEVPPSMPSRFGLAMPSLLQPKYLTQSVLGALVYSNLDWHLEDVKIQEAQATIRLGKLLRGLASRKTLRIPSIKDDNLGAFQLSTNWTLSLPYSFELLDSK